jgi:hypothetical protein
LSFSDSHKNLDFALDQLHQLRYDGKPVTSAGLNVIMSGAAERGDIDRILSLIQEFERNNVRMDADSFSFCFESLGKNLLRRKHYSNDTDHVRACLIAAESFLTLMEEKDIAPDRHVIRNYVELLCEVGQIETASAVVLEAASEANLVCSKTIYRVAMANAKLRKFDVARQVAACRTGEPLPLVLAGIEREEQQTITSNEARLLAERDELREELVEQPVLNATRTAGSPSTFWSTTRADIESDQHSENDCSTKEEQYARRWDRMQDPAP